MAFHDTIKQLAELMDEMTEQQKKVFQIVDECPVTIFQNVHQGYPSEALVRFLKAREWNVPKAHKMGLPVFAIGVGQSSFDKASVHYYVQSHIQINEYRDRIILPAAGKKFGKHIGTCIKVLDMTGLKLSALGQIKLMTIISTIDDLNYPEKTETYYIVNAPYVFSSCWKVVKPLLQERTRKKVQVLQGCGRDELLKIMDYSSLPHFCRREGSSSSRSPLSSPGADNCFSLDHPFHQQLYYHMKQQAHGRGSIVPIKQGSFHVTLPDPDPDGEMIAETIELEMHKFEEQSLAEHGNGLTHPINGLKISSD
ncbi:hypothetical protein HPP92_020149 [Vanilla planifolia]|uniref:CRAL-TRIO domain-containing protein n=1 Tax=Vanilla planifolia TaxID=51239 RepID=A0A835UMG8_VANPL|nr:hypothetical protein HPP92_020149 [Vanilla planifolia]